MPLSFLVLICFGVLQKLTFLKSCSSRTVVLTVQYVEQEIDTDCWMPASSFYYIHLLQWNTELLRRVLWSRSRFSVFTLQTLWGQFGNGLFLIQHDCTVP